MPDSYAFANLTPIADDDFACDIPPGTFAHDEHTGDDLPQRLPSRDETRR